MVPARDWTPDPATCGLSTLPFSLKQANKQTCKIIHHQQCGKDIISETLVSLGFIFLISLSKFCPGDRLALRNPGPHSAATEKLSIHILGDLLESSDQKKHVSHFKDIHDSFCEWPSHAFIKCLNFNLPHPAGARNYEELGDKKWPSGEERSLPQSPRPSRVWEPPEMNHNILSPWAMLLPLPHTLARKSFQKFVIIFHNPKELKI